MAEPTTRKSTTRKGDTDVAAAEVPPTHFVPQSTRDNYEQMARDAAAAAGITPKQAMGQFVKDWERQHEIEPTGGYDHLANWGRDVDPAETTGPSALALAKARAVESARRDPVPSLLGDQTVVAEAVTAIEAEAVPVAADITGVTPNTGPVTVDPPETPAGQGDASS